MERPNNTAAHNILPIRRSGDERLKTKISTIYFYSLLKFSGQGWNDIGYQSTDLSGFTPHLDMLAATGIKLTSYYGMHIW